MKNSFGRQVYHLISNGKRNDSRLSQLLTTVDTPKVLKVIRLLMAEAYEQTFGFGCLQPVCSDIASFQFILF